MIHAGLPLPANLAYTLSALVRRQVTVRPDAFWAIEPREPLCVGVYRDEHQALEGLWVCDVSLAASLGGVLMLMPAGVVSEAIAAAELSDDLLEGAREVANVCASSFRDKRVRLAEFCPPGQRPGGEAGRALLSAERRVDLRVQVAGYPGGRLVLVGPQAGSGEAGEAG